MKKWFKWLKIILGIVIAIVLIRALLMWIF